jgi:SAM-dependent methyltransferase
MIKLEVGLWSIPSTDHINEVLDLGCGTGIWMQEYALANPHATIHGLDISPPEPETSPITFPSSCHFTKVNLEDDWSSAGIHDQFDYIHARMLILAINDWEKLFKQAFSHLRPGGYFETLDLLLGGQILDANNPNVTNQYASLLKWLEYAISAISSRGIDPNSPTRFASMLSAAGFEIVQETRPKIYMDPSKSKASSPEDKVLVKDLYMQTSLDVMDILGQKIFIGSGLSQEQVEDLTANAKKELINDGQVSKLQQT